MKNVFAIAVFALLVSILAPGLRAQSGPYQYTTVTPCRVVDTRNPAGTNGGPAMFENNQRDFQVRGTCGVPSTAKAVSINLTITQASAPSWLIIWPSGIAQPQVSTLNFDPTFWALANGAIVGLSSNTKDLSVYNAHGSVHVIVDVTGYFQ